MHGSSDVPVAGSDDSAERRRRLLGVKLRALARDHTGTEADPTSFAPGAALVVGDRVWVLLDDESGRRPDRQLGSALAWALRRHATSLDVITEVDAGLLARRAAAFSFPVRVWRAVGRQLIAAEPEPLEPPAAADAAHLALRELIVAGGATPVVEHGVVLGEVRGLEVCRVVVDPDTAHVRLDVGVGIHDREMFQIMHGDIPTVDALAGVVDAVRRHRAPSAPQHPLNRLAAERFLRWRLEQEPALVGASRLEAVQPPIARTNLIDTVPCAAVGVDVAGAPLVVVCSTGVDLDVVPYAIDARLAAAAGIADVDRVDVELRTVIAVPARDRLAVTVELAGLLAQPVEVVPVTVD